MRFKHVLAILFSYFLPTSPYNLRSYATRIGIRACLHGGEGPRVGEVTRLGGVTHLSI